MKISNENSLLKVYSVRQEVECFETTFKGEKHFLLSNRKTGLVYELPEVGFEVVNRLKNKMSPNDIVKDIIKEYDVDIELATTDLKELLEELIELRFITEIDE